MGPHAASRPLTLSEQADELEEKMMNELNDKIATKSALAFRKVSRWLSTVLDPM